VVRDPGGDDGRGAWDGGWEWEWEDGEEAGRGVHWGGDD